MIQEAVFTNFKALRDVTIDLGRLTVLVGPNGSGKTSVLEGLLVLAELERERHYDLVAAEHMSHENRTRGAVAETSLSCSDSDRKLSISGEGPWTYAAEIFSDPANPRQWAREHEVPYIVDFGPAEMLRLSAEQLAAPSYSDEPIPVLRPDGSGLASVLAFMPGNHPEK